jgi:hypothetical protein
MVMRQERENRLNETPHNSPIRELELPILVQEDEELEQAVVRPEPIVVDGESIEP